MNNTTEANGGIVLYWDVWSVFIILGVLILFGNSLVCAMFIVWKNLRNPTNTFLVMLASADLLISLVFIPLYIGGHFLEYYHTVHVTENIDSIIKFVLFASVFNLYAVTCDRYIAVMHALRYNALMTRSTVFTIAAAAWLFPALLTGILLIIKSTAMEAVQYTLFGMEVVFVIIPGFLMAIVYAKIFNEAKKQIKQVASLEVYDARQQKEKARKRKSEHKVAQTCALLVILFFICWIPTCVEQILYMASIEIPQVYSDMAMILMIANSAVNPFLYGLTKQDFRSKLQIIFRYRTKQSNLETTGKSDRSSVSLREKSPKNRTDAELTTMHCLQKQGNNVQKDI